MAMYNFIKYSLNYADTTGSLWIYPKNEATDFNADIVNNIAFKSLLVCKVRILKNVVADGNNSIVKYAAMALTLKYLSEMLNSIQDQVKYH